MPLKGWNELREHRESNCDCRCGATFRSLAQVDYEADPVKFVSERPCPQCGRTDDLRAIRSDPERFGVGPGDVRNRDS